MHHLRFLLHKPLRMKTIYRKHEILESLGEMDQTQMEKVLTYIKSILNSEAAKTRAYEKFKSHALREIRQALNEGR